MFRFRFRPGAIALGFALVSAPILAAAPAGAVPIVRPDAVTAPSAIETAAFINRRRLCYYRFGWHGPGLYPCRRYLRSRGFVRGLGLRHRRFVHRRDVGRGRIVRPGIGHRIGPVRGISRRGIYQHNGGIHHRNGILAPRAGIGTRGLARRDVDRGGFGTGTGRVGARFGREGVAPRSFGGPRSTGTGIGGGGYRGGLGIGGGAPGGGAAGLGIGRGGGAIGGGMGAGRGGMGGGGAGMGGGHFGGGGMGGGGMGGGGMGGGRR